MGESRSGPRWSSLYLIVLTAIAASLAVDASPLGPLGREVAEIGLVVLTFAAMLGWVHRNRVPLAKAEWSSSAGATLQIRVVGAPPSGERARPAFDPPARRADRAGASIDSSTTPR